MLTRHTYSFRARVRRAACILALAPIAFVPACQPGGGESGAPLANSGTLTTQISDPDPCTDRYEHAWVTVRDVKAHVTASAAPGDAGFVDLTPGLSANPRQLDLLGPLTSCFPAALGSINGVTPGTYQQVRIFLLDNTAPSTGVTPPLNNSCRAAGDTVFNCVVDSKGSVRPLKLPADSGNGIAVPPSQVACGGLAVAAGRAADIAIHFNTCASVVEGADPRSVILKPTLWARLLPHSSQ